MDKIITLNRENIDEAHICCAISDKKCQDGVQAKKELLKAERGTGYTFKKLDVRGKVFIEYGPWESSWLPLDAPGYTVLNCFWVSGKYKGQGWGKALLRECEADSKGRKGIVAVSSDKKRPFFSDPKFLKLQGFTEVDQGEPYFRLWVKKFDPSARDPRFLDSARSGCCSYKEGLSVYYSDFCPFTGYWNEVVLKELAEEKGLPLHLHKITSREEGRRAPVPWVLNAVFYNGRFLTQEIKIDRILERQEQI